MKTIVLAALLIAAMTPPAAAADIPICPPRWMADALRSFGIGFQCRVDGGDPVEDSAGTRSSIVPLPVRSLPVEAPSGIIRPPVQSVPIELPSVPLPGHHDVPELDGVTIRERWTDQRG